MHGEVANPWIIEFIPRLLTNDLNPWGEIAKAFVESCVAYPDEMPQLTKYAWMGGVSVEANECVSETILSAVKELIF